MKTLLCLILALSLSSAYADQFGQRQVTIETVNHDGFVKAGCRQLTFVFTSSFTGSIQGAAFTGSTDSSLNIVAQSQDTIGDVYYKVSAGSMRIVEVR